MLFDGIGLRVARDLVPEPDVPDWRLRVFEDRAHGVSVLYPASYTTVVEGTDKLLSVASPYGVPRMDLGVTPDASTGVAELAEAYVASLLAVGERNRPFPRPSDGEGPDAVTDADTALLHGDVVAQQVIIDWRAPDSEAELRTLVLSVRDGARGRITLCVTGTRGHDWDDLRRLAQTLRVDR